MSQSFPRDFRDFLYCFLCVCVFPNFPSSFNFYVFHDFHEFCSLEAILQLRHAWGKVTKHESNWGRGETISWRDFSDFFYILGLIEFWP